MNITTGHLCTLASASYFWTVSLHFWQLDAFNHIRHSNELKNLRHYPLLFFCPRFIMVPIVWSSWPGTGFPIWKHTLIPSHTLILICWGHHERPMLIEYKSFLDNETRFWAFQLRKPIYEWKSLSVNLLCRLFKADNHLNGLHTWYMKMKSYLPFAAPKYLLSNIFYMLPLNWSGLLFVLTSSN